MNITRLGKGELVLSHATFRQPVKIVFPKPAYRRPPIGEEPSKEAGKDAKKPLYLGVK
jgi:hypothetical protein